MATLDELAQPLLITPFYGRISDQHIHQRFLPSPSSLLMDPTSLPVTEHSSSLTTTRSIGGTHSWGRILYIGTFPMRRGHISPLTDAKLNPSNYPPHLRPASLAPLVRIPKVFWITWRPLQLRSAPPFLKQLSMMLSRPCWNQCILQTRKWSLATPPLCSYHHMVFGYSAGMAVRGSVSLTVSHVRVVTVVCCMSSVSCTHVVCCSLY